MSNRLVGLGIALLMVGLAIAPVRADVAGSVTQSYDAGSGVLPGMLVQLKGRSSVVPLTGPDAKNMLGVVVPVGSAPIVLTPSGSSGQQVLVASSGRYSLLVSNQNGPVKPDDYLSASAVSGVAMRAQSNQKEVIGRAAGGFDGSHDVLGSETLKGSLGRTSTVMIGSVPADIRLGQNPAYQADNQVPALLNKLANSIANKPVSAIRIYLSTAVIVAILCMVGGMFYGGTRSSINAIGRNPLAKRAIGRGLLQTILLALVIFAAGVFGAYLILL